MTGRKVGYKRLSSVDRFSDQQLTNYDLDMIHTDHCNAGSRNKPELTICLKNLQRGDVFYVHSMDKLTNNLKEVISIVEGLIRTGVAIYFHEEELWFSSNKDQQQQLQLKVLTAASSFEKSIKRQSKREGMKAAQIIGKPIGAPKKLTPNNIEEIQTLKQQSLPVTEIAKRFNVSRKTIYNALQEKAPENGVISA